MLFVLELNVLALTDSGEAMTLRMLHTTMLYISKSLTFGR